MIDRTLPVHHSCPKKGCDICQRDWPCARLVRTKHDAADKPTDQELYDYWISTSPEFGCADPVGFARANVKAASAMRIILNRHAVDHARAALAKWGRPAVQPVPVSERLPGPEDCDKQGHVWAWRVYRPQNDDDDGDFWMQIPANWLSHIPFSSNWSHWLPANALPTPEAAND